MKRISVKESRRNSVNCGRKVRARHQDGGRFCAQGKPMFGSTYVHYEVGAQPEGMSYGGIAAVHRLVTKLGLVEGTDATLKLLKVHLPYHESDHACLCVARLPARSAQAGRQVLNLTYNIMCGGTRLEDIERLRHDGAYMNALSAPLIPDPTTAGDFTRRFTKADVIGLMDCINAVRSKLWRTRAASLLSPVAYIDVDGTSAPTYGQKKGGMDISYKGVWGYAPLIVSLANTKEVLYVVNRPGNASSHQGAAPWIDAAIGMVKPHAKRVCLRGDTDFSLTGQLDLPARSAQAGRWAKNVDFIFGMDCNHALRTRAEALDEGAWQRLHRPVAPQKRQRRDNEKQRIVKARGYLKLALRKNISKAKGEQTLFDEIRYFFYITTRHDLTPAEVVFAANKRCDQENVIEQLKNGVNALRVPLYDLISNWAYMVIAALAWNIKSWFALMMHRKKHRRKYIRMDFRTFLNHIILYPCRVVRHACLRASHRQARSTTIRITCLRAWHTHRQVGYQPSLNRLLSAWATIERTGFTHDTATNRDHIPSTTPTAV